MLAAGTGFDKTADDNDVILIKDPRIIIAVNPDPDDYKPKPEPVDAKLSGLVEVPEKIEKNVLQKMGKEERKAHEKAWKVSSLLLFLAISLRV